MFKLVTRRQAMALGAVSAVSLFSRPVRADLAPLIEAAGGLGKHVMVAGIEASNRASIRLHHGFGFVETGHLKEVGYKFDRWLDLVFMQKILD